MVLRLISVAGGFVTDDIWHRIIQIVTNHEDLHQYAAQTVYEAVQSQQAHETMVKVAAYILGWLKHVFVL